MSKKSEAITKLRLFVFIANFKIFSPRPWAKKFAAFHKILPRKAAQCDKRESLQPRQPKTGMQRTER